MTRRLTLYAEGRISLPLDVLDRYRLSSGEEFLLEKTESGLLLHPCGRMCAESTWRSPRAVIAGAAPA